MTCTPAGGRSRSARSTGRCTSSTAATSARLSCRGYAGRSSAWPPCLRSMTTATCRPASSWSTTSGESSAPGRSATGWSVTGLLPSCPGYAASEPPGYGSTRLLKGNPRTPRPSPTPRTCPSTGGPVDVKHHPGQSPAPERTGLFGIAAAGPIRDRLSPVNRPPGHKHNFRNFSNGRAYFKHTANFQRAARLVTSFAESEVLANAKVGTGCGHVR